MKRDDGTPYAQKHVMYIFWRLRNKNLEISTKKKLLEGYNGAFGTQYSLNDDLFS